MLFCFVLSGSKFFFKTQPKFLSQEFAMPSKDCNNLFTRLFPSAACTFLILCAGLAAAQTTTILHQFQVNNSKDGAQSYAGLLAGPHGELYGNSWNGGNNWGIVFELIPPTSSGGAWRYNILYSFGALPDGANPRGTLTRDHNGNLYGSTQVGGTFGCGTVFELSPPATAGGAWTESVLYSFDCINNSDGAGPLAGVVFDNLGNLYGTTEGGGVHGLGAVFKLTPPSTAGGAWTETLLHSFQGSHDGDEPFYGLTFAGHGTFYGFTSYGGSSGKGTFYQITASGKETVLYAFHDGPDGGVPSGAPILDASGNVYGTANVGGATGNGVVFQMTPPAVVGQPWTETVLHSFSVTDGFSPSGVTFGPSGVLYGTSWGGGTTGTGVVFELTPPTSGGSWTETVLHDFNGSDGQSVWAAPTLFGGTLYGVTHLGGTKNAGTVFAVTP
jgi:uncharacterized repeat protein (TIGR03803 family)